MKFRFIGLILFFMLSAPLAIQATDFQIDKIVNEGLAKAHADQLVDQNANVAAPTQPAIELSGDPAKDPSPEPTNAGLKTEKTDPEKVQSARN